MSGWGFRVVLVLACLACGAANARAQARDGGALAPDSSTAGVASQALLQQSHELAKRIELSQDRQSRWLMGGVIGLVAGAGITALILHSGGSTSLCNRSENQDAMSSGECWGLTAAGGLVGAGVGAWIGSRLQK